MSEWLYTRQTVRECLRAQRRNVKQLLIAPGLPATPILREIAELARAQRVPIREVPRERLHTISPDAQGLALEVDPYPFVDVEDILAQPGDGPILVLDALQDPHNVGSLLRTANAVGARGAILPTRRSATITPAVVHASAGAAEHMLVAQVVNLARTVEMLKACGVWVAALDAGGEQTIYQADLRGPFALIVGSEHEGVHRLLRQKADFVLRIPMRGRVASLNAAVAGAVALYELWRQHTHQPSR